jgi:serine/threonine protein kinase
VNVFNTAARDPLIGRRLGEYQIAKLLGDGGFARVYLAYAHRFPVALKVLDPSLARDPEQVRRFYNDFWAVYQVIARLRGHRNIVRPYKFGQANGYSFFAMEYLDGGTLEQRLSPGRPLALKDTVNIFAQVASALDAAHALNIVHRDVKPNNILFDRIGRAALTDFGIAKFLTDLQQSVARTPPTQRLGSAPYMSPEQVQGSPVITRASDVYSLGIVAYRVLAGCLPFDNPDPLVVWHAQVYKPPPPPRQFNPHLNPETERVILWALDKRPERRPASAGMFAKSLAASGGFTTSQVYRMGFALPLAQPRQRMPTPPPGSGAALPRSTSRRSVSLPVIAGITIAAILLIIGLFLVMSSPGGAMSLLPFAAEPALAFAAQQGSDWDLFVMEGQHIRQIVMSGSDEIHPSWSPDRQRLVFVSNQDGYPNIYTVRANGQELIQITRDRATNASPSWSPDGSQIVYDSNVGGNTQIYRVSANGGMPRQLTFGNDLDGDPAWSPDGKTIAFNSDRSGDYEIYTMDTEGRLLLRLTRSAGRDSLPAWSPDGRQIALECQQGQRLAICVMNADGSNRQDLTHDSVDCRQPAWATEGQQITFSRHSLSGWQLYSINRDGTGMRFLTGPAPDNAYPAWQLRMGAIR